MAKADVKKAELEVFRGSKTIDGKRVDYVINLVDYADILMLEMIKIGADGKRYVTVANLAEWRME